MHLNDKILSSQPVKDQDANPDPTRIPWEKGYNALAGKVNVASQRPAPTGLACHLCGRTAAQVPITLASLVPRRFACEAHEPGQQFSSIHRDRLPK